jgi:hypothetical protein
VITSASLVLKGSHAEPLGNVGSTADCQQPKVIGLRGVGKDSVLLPFSTGAPPLGDPRS